MADHWFDALNKALVRQQPRRPLLRAIAAAITSLGLVALPESGMGKKGKNGKHGKNGNKDKKKDRKKNKKKDKPPPPPDPAQTCSGGVCLSRWPSNSQYDTDQRKYCEFICDQCSAPGHGPFCIIVGNVADCCDEGLKCCGEVCVNTFDNDNHCGSCNNRCSPGKVCFGGDCLCIEGLTLCGEICSDTSRDENN